MLSYLYYTLNVTTVLSDKIISILQVKKQRLRKNEHFRKMFIDELSLMVKAWKQARYPKPEEQLGKLENISKQYVI